MLSPRGGGRARKLTDKAFEKLRDEFPWLERHPGKEYYHLLSIHIQGFRAF